jgi:signal transduction histidine kinase
MKASLLRGNIRMERISFFISLLVFLTFSTHCLAQQQSKSTFEDAKVDDFIRRILKNMDDFRSDSAIILINQALNYIDQNEQIEEYYFLLSYRAEVLYYDGLFSEAMRDLDKCDQLAFQLEDSLLISNVYNLRGLLNESIHNHKEALVELGKSLAFFPKNANSPYPVSELHHVYGNIGANLMEKGMLDSAKYFFEKSLQLAQKVRAERAIAVAYWSLGELELKKKMNKKALEYFIQSEEVASKANDKDMELDALSGQCLAMLSIKGRKEIMEALYRADRHLEKFSEEIGLITKRNYSKQASQVWEMINEPEMAIRKLNSWYSLDSLIQKKNMQSALATQAALLRSDMALDLEQIKYQQAATDLKQARLRQQLFLVSGLFVIFILSTLLIAFRKRQKQKLKLSQLEMERLRQEKMISEFKIREQLAMDMHDDLGAGLSALKLQSEMMLRREKEPFQKEQMAGIAKNAGELMDSMRQIIWSLNEEQASVEELISYISNYARIYLSENDLEFHLQKEENWPEYLLNPEQRRNIFLVIKEVLHNTVKHANARSIDMKLAWNNGFEISIKDDGIGLKKDMTVSSGNGHRNIESRISKLGGTVRWVNDNGVVVFIKIEMTPNQSSIVS